MKKFGLLSTLLLAGLLLTGCFEKTQDGIGGEATCTEEIVDASDISEISEYDGLCYDKNGEINPNNVNCYDNLGNYNGLWVYVENGQLDEKVSYKHGVKDGKRIVYDKGKIYYEENYKDGLLDGEFIEYYENGNIRGKIIWKEGKDTGNYVDYYENGNLDTECVRGGNEYCKGYDINGNLEWFNGYLSKEECDNIGGKWYEGNCKMNNRNDVNMF